MSADDFHAGIKHIVREACGDEAVYVPFNERLRELKAHACQDDLTDAERDVVVAQMIAEMHRLVAEERRRRTN